MKNVRDLRYTFRHLASLMAAQCDGFVVWISRNTLRAGGRNSFVATAMFCTVINAAAVAQDALIGGNPSGSAVPNINVNARNMGISVRAGHEAGSVVGRDQSASTLSVSPYAKFGNSMFTLDTRLLYGNEGELSWSFGGGYRRYLPAWDVVIGGYGFHDSDQLTGTRFQQWVFGGELLTNHFELRGNYYRPYSDTSRLVEQRIDPASAVFVGTQVHFDRIDTFAEALEGFDAEVGRMLPGELAERMKLRVFGGGYSYSGVGTDQFNGVSARLQADINNRLELGLKVTDDKVFNTNVAFTAMLHFGSFVSQEHTSRSAIQRMAEPIRRNLNVVANVTDVVVPGQIANNTAGMELRIIHVNSNATTPPGAGTVENPFDSLFTASLVPNVDAIFVHGGSTFNAAPDNTLNLAANQSVFGEGLITTGIEHRKVVNTIAIQQFGDLVLPDSPTFATNLAALGPAPFGGQPANTPVDPLLMRPMLMGAAGNGIQMNTNSRVGGLIIDGAGASGIVIDGVDGANVRDTLVTNVAGAGILIQNLPTVTSTATIIDTVIDSAGGPAFHVNGGTGNIGFTATSTTLDPAFGAIVNSAQEAVLIENRIGGTINMFGSTIDDNGGAGILIRNSISNVTIDNANIQNSTATGIAITDSDGNFSFRDSVRAATTINQATGASVRINNVGTGSNVTFENLSITNPLNSGIDIDALGGTFSFSEDLTIGAPGAGATPEAAISVATSTPTGVVSLFGDVLIQGSLDRGVEVTANAAGSTVEIGGLLSVVNVASQAVAVVNNAGTFTVNGGTSITDGIVPGTLVPTTGAGIFVSNSTGAITFNGGTGITDNLTVAPISALNNPPGVHVVGSESLVSFDTLNITKVTGRGIELTNNQAGASGPGEFAVGTLTINSSGGSNGAIQEESLFATDTSSIRIGGGSINTVSDEAVNIENSGINITLASVSSQNSLQAGIRLVNTNMPGFRAFRVTGDLGTLPNASGGFITGAAQSGVILRNAGDVTLNRMNIFDNNYGIWVRNSGLAIDDTQALTLQLTQVSQNNVRGIDAENLLSLNIEDSLFDLNGDDVALPDPDGTVLAVNRESIFLNYTERLNDETTTLFTQFANPYSVRIARTIFNTLDGASDDDPIQITNTIAAVGAHADVNIFDNVFNVADGGLAVGTNPDQSVVLFDWNGVARVNLSENALNLNGITVGNTVTGFDFRNLSITDESILSVVSNLSLGSTQPDAVGINVRTEATLAATIQGNVFSLAGLRSTGLQADLGPNAAMLIADNTFEFLSDGGTGMLFTMVEQPAAFTISNNVINLTDTAVTAQERGIIFLNAIGTPDLFGPLNNTIQLLNPGLLSNINVDFTIPRANGQIVINGALRP